MAEKRKDTNKLKARRPRGFDDRGPAEIAATRRMLETIRQVYERYGFEPVETPAIEYTDALGKFLPDQDRPNEGVFSFQDDDEQWLSLRYDLTAPLARYVAENFDTLPKPHRSYRVGWVFRNEKPGPGRFRQFMQFDADTVGSASPAADAEMCMMAADTMEALGIRREGYEVKVNNRKLLDGVMDVIGLAGDQNAGRRLIALRALDKYDRLGKAGVRELLGQERRDESGDVTKGADLNDDQISLLLWFLTLRTEPFGVVQETIDEFNPLIRTGVGEAGEKVTDMLSAMSQSEYGSNSTFMDGVKDLRQIEQLVVGTEYQKNVRLDPSVVRGLEYYTGTVFEVELRRSVPDEHGNLVSLRYGSVGGGGRYDGLVARFRGEPVPATGFSIGVSRLQAALTLTGSPEPGPVVVTVFDKERMADYQRMVKVLRDAGIKAELYLGGSGFNAQMKYANKRNAPCVVIQGSNEKQHPGGPKVIVKNLVLGAELPRFEGTRDEYRKKQKKSEKLVLESRLLNAVRKMLAEHTPVADNPKRATSKTKSTKTKGNARRRRRVVASKTAKKTKTAKKARRR
jgi:histidyl-tRNA synthetase